VTRAGTGAGEGAKLSEFVECQNCGRRFLAENLDCPYCGGEDADDTATLVADLMRTVAPSTAEPPPRPPHAGIFDVLFIGFAVLAIAIAVWAALALVRTPGVASRLWLGFAMLFAAGTAAGVIGRRRWARITAIAFIACGTALGVATLLATGVGPFVALGGGPVALLLFAWPFLSVQARERFRR
jgi:hypothetical protein